MLLRYTTRDANLCSEVIREPRGVFSDLWWCSKPILGTRCKAPTLVSKAKDERHVTRALTSKDPALDFFGSFVTRHPTTSRITVPPSVGPCSPVLLLSSLGNRRTIGGGGGAALCRKNNAIQ